MIREGATVRVSRGDAWRLTTAFSDTGTGGRLGDLRALCGPCVEGGRGGFRRRRHAWKGSAFVSVMQAAAGRPSSRSRQRPAQFPCPRPVRGRHAAGKVGRLAGGVTHVGTVGR
jgi:hypothetical protein